MLVQLMDYSIMLIQYFVEGNLEVSIKLKYGIIFNNSSHNSFQLEVRIDKVHMSEMARQVILGSIY